MTAPHPALAGDRPRPWLDRAAAVTLALGWAFVLVFIYYSFRAKFSIPYVDDWSWLVSLQDHAWTTGLWSPHNEHVIVIPRLLVWLDFWIWGWPGYATLIAAILSHAAMAAILISTCRDRTRKEARLLSGAVLVLMFLTYELQGVVFPSSVNFPLVAVFATLSIASLARCADARSQPATTRWVLISAALSVMAMLCLTNGLFVPFVLVGLSIAIGLPRSTTAALLGLAVLGPIVRFALGGMPGTVLTASSGAVARFAMAMLAGPLASLSPQLSVVVGVLYVGGAFWGAYRLFQSPVKSSSRALLVGNIWFVLMSAGMAAMGRAQFDLSVGAESRYTELAALGWASLLLLVPKGTIRKPVGVFAGALLPACALLGLPLQVFIGQVWAAKADHLDVASLVLTVGLRDPNWIWRIHPGGESYIDPVLPQLRARGIGFVDFPERGVQLPPGSSCTGTMHAIETPTPQGGVKVHGHVQEAGTTLRIVDGESRVAGLGKPAPIVQLPRATANDLVWAELDIWRGRLDTTGDWLGFAAWGSGPPYRAELMDGEGRVVCQLPIDCCTPAPRPPVRGEIVVRGSMPEGFLDSADCSTITGWAWDPIRQMEALDVAISVSNGDRTMVKASEFRPDLEMRLLGDGRHGFVVGAPVLPIAPGTWRVDATIAATGVPLHGSPKTITCP